MWNQWLHSRGGVGTEAVLSVYGALYVEDGNTAQEMNIASAKLTGFTNASEFLHITISVDNANMIITEGGVYGGMYSASFLGTANSEFEAHLYVNGVEQPEGFHRKISGGDRGSAAFAILPKTLNINDIVDVRGNSNSDGDSITLIDSQLAIYRIG